MSGEVSDNHQERPRRFKFIGCEIIYREACYLAATGRHQVDVAFMLKGLHDLPTKDMLAKLQAVVDAVKPEDGYEAILLGYARCNDGLVGLRARDLPLVIPRAHDCIAFFFGSLDAYNAYFTEHPGTYFYTSGWIERNVFGDYATPAYGMAGVMAQLGLADSYETMLATYGKEGADFIIESMGGWQKHYRRGLYLEMGVCDESAFIARARKMAERNGWEFEVRKGDMRLLEKLFRGEWDGDFLTIPPGHAIEARNDADIMGLAPCAQASCPAGCGGRGA